MDSKAIKSAVAVTYEAPIPPSSRWSKMKTFITLASFLAAVPAALSLSGVTNEHLSRRQSAAIDSFVASEAPIAKAGIFANTGSGGSKVSGAKAGVVVAGPSKGDPVDYFYTWIRDSSLVRSFRSISLPRHFADRCALFNR